MQNLQRYFPKITFRYLSILIIVFIAYTISGKLGLQLAFLNASATAIWPPTGIALASILIFGFDVIPAIFIGAFVVNVTTQGGIPTSLGIALGNTLEGIIGAYLVIKFANGKDAFKSVSGVFKFCILSAFVSTTVSATIGVTTLVLASLASFSTLPSVWLTWWLGDMGGDLIVAPLILLWALNLKFEYNIRKNLESLGFFIVVVFSAWIIFSGIMPYPYLMIAILAWGAFHYEQREEATALFLLAFISVWSTIHGFGPYALVRGGLNQSLVLLQMFLSTATLATLTTTAALLERKHFRGELATTEKKFESLFEKSFDAVVLIDINSKILYASSSVKRILGYNPEELIGMTGFDLIAPEDKPKTIKTLAKLVLKPGSTVTVEYQTIRKDKKIIWVEATGTNLLLDKGINAVVVNFRDITDKKLAQDKLVQEKASDEAILSSIGEGMIVTDSAGIIVLTNETAEEMLGYTKREILGKRLIDVTRIQDQTGELIPENQRPMTNVLTHGKKFITSSKYYYTKKNGKRFPVRLTLTPIISDRNVVGTVEVFQDITEELEIDKVKTEFVSLASHQLRTPLATINWYLERLIGNEMGEVPQKQRKYLEEVYHASERMVDLVNALLNASRLELGTFNVEPSNTNLITISKQVVREQEQSIKQKELKIIEKFDPKISEIKADPKLLIIIAENLLSNAVKYSKPGGEIKFETSQDTKNYLIKIEDNGCGIPKKSQSKIFTKLFRADNAKMIDPEGSGLGLYIVKEIVDHIGGKIWFESEEDKGTTFFVSFPKSGMSEIKGKKKIIRNSS